jgi:uncharacterized protein (DUF2132 family)
MNLLKLNLKSLLGHFSKPCLSFCVLLVLACGENSTESFSKEFTIETSEDYLEETIIETTTNPNLNTSQEQKIIKTGVLEFQTQNLSKTYSQIKALLNTYEGYIQSDNSGKNYNRQYQNLQVRIPSKNFQVIIDSISQSVNYFDTKSISRQDVTEEFIDLTARLKSKRELESRYIQLLSKANTVKEILEIERELSTIREDIEAKQGRLEYLQSQVSYSTLNINFYKEISNTGITVSYGTKIVNALKSGWFGISSVFLGILTLWPLLIIGLVVAIIIRRWLKSSNKNTSK